MTLCQPSIHKSICFLLAARYFRSGLPGGVTGVTGMTPRRGHAHFNHTLALRVDEESPTNQQVPRGRARQGWENVHGETSHRVAVVTTAHSCMLTIVSTRLLGH